MQQFRIEFCRTFKGCEQPPQALGFVFFIANGIILFLRQLADYASGSILVERLCVQNIVQLDLRSAVYRRRLFFWLRDTLWLFCQPAKQLRDLLFDFRGRWFGAYTLECFLRRCPLWQTLLGLALLDGCLK